MHTSVFPAFRAEMRANLRLAAPLIAAQIAGVGMGTVDSIFAGRLGPQALAAVAVGVNFNVIFFVLSMGVLMACSPIVAHLVGGGATSGVIGAFARRARRLALVLAALWALSMNLLAAPVLRHLNLEAGTAQLAVEFVRALSLSSFGMTLWMQQRFVAEGLGVTRPILLAGVVGLSGNIVFDWLFLFGPVPALRFGAVGCGVATSLSALLMAAALAAQFRGLPRLRQALSGPAAPAAVPSLREMLRIGVPIGAILLAEAGLFIAASMLMAHFGDRVIAAYQVALNFASLMFMIPLGVGMATTVRVGHAAGAGNRAEAAWRGRVGMCMGMLNAASNAAIMLLLPLSIAHFYSEDQQIAGLAAQFLLLAAAFQLFDGLQVTANGALRGVKDTRMPLAITLVAYWLVGLPVACALAFLTPLGPAGLWWGLTAGLCVAAVGLSLRFVTVTRAPLIPEGSSALA